MGEVFRAHQLNLKRDVAIKVISEEILQNLEENSEEVANAMERLQREVQTMAQVRHGICAWGYISLYHVGRGVRR